MRGRSWRDWRSTSGGLLDSAVSPDSGVTLLRLRTQVGLLLVAASLAGAQDPSRDYLTIATPHFRVSFTKPLEGVARRVAGGAERAYTQLTAEMHPPRGVIDVLVTDDFDFSNGSATTYPTNRIIVYAMPPVNDFGLRYTTDWAQMVMTHELAHIFHLDRVRGLWALGQRLFGRSPFLFPNMYQPSWVIEGLAVYEESRLAGQGRIEGPEHNLLARAAAIDHVFPGIGGLSLARPTFPQGTSAYGFGSLFMDYLARTRGDSAIRRFVESSSGQLIPYLIDIPARRAFGKSFGSAWREWQRSIEATVVNPVTPPVPGWRDLTGDQLAANYPRWMNGETLSFSGTTGRDVLSAFTVSPAGDRTRLGRRNGLSPTVPLPNGDHLFAQLEYTGAYTYRSDLFTQAPGGRPQRLTTGLRLFTPDARADGAIISVQSSAGMTRLVRVSAGGAVLPLTAFQAETLWSEPRWSHRGDRIVASRWVRGGVYQVVVIDTLGAPLHVVASARQLLASPSWTPDDSGIIYTAGGRDSNDAYLARIGGDGAVRVTNSASGFFEPAIRGSTLAGFTLRGGGYRLGAGSMSVDSSASVVHRDFDPDRRLASATADSSPARAYSAWGQMLPRYWVPLAEAGIESGTYRVGGYTEAWDILRRHYAYAELRVPTNSTRLVGALQYQYRGFGLPVVSMSASQDWNDRFGRVVSRTDPSTVLGIIRRRVRDGEALATWVRPRARSSFSVSLGGGMEQRFYDESSPGVIALIDSARTQFRTAVFPRLTLSSSYSRYLVPPFAISAEDGFSVGVTVRERFRSDFNATGGPSTSVVSTVSLFKSLDLPGYAHHVLAARVAGGWADTRTNSYFEVGGVSGGSFQVFPGYTVGEGRRTFPVRGFQAASLSGIRAMSGSAEYRAPLSLTHRSLSTLPTFLQRSALTLFGDYGVAWCPSTLTTRQVCVDPSQESRLAVGSVGGELSVNAGLLSWDSPTRLRLGVARPILNASLSGGRRIAFYFTVGSSF